ncbi:Glycosyltransferase WbsX [Lachnospiraceae bacterium XBB2008]|nr:Glycosyltransferase WbsX [Lachnospiraceae bacterium XBB2008]
MNTIKDNHNNQNSIKTIAFYLPQFHEVQENSKWWGEGYTDWIAVKKATPLFKNHNQPRVPLNSYYYDLMNKDVMIWQSELMKSYGIDGLCFYHYYFKDGRKILEKPAENLLRWRDIDMPFCFAWANGSWGRTWSNIWAWNELEETKDDSDENGILMDQKYGREKTWKDHFEYLLPFLCDSRYIRYEDKPIILFHSAESIPCLKSMIRYWRGLAHEVGLKDLYFIGMNASVRSISKGLDAVIYNTPHQAWALEMARIEAGIKMPSFDLMWQNILQYRPADGVTIYYEGTGDYDDTPRRGQGSGIAITDYSADKLRHYMEELYLKSYASDNEFIFYNAWNEWGEGMYLEPDEKEGYDRLEAIRDAQTGAKQKILKMGVDAYKQYRDMIQLEVTDYPADNRIERLKSIIKCLDDLLSCAEENKDISSLLMNSDIHSVAIYGMGQVGRHLAIELEKKGMTIEYVIDKNLNIQVSYPLYSINDELPVVDAIIVTPIWDYDTIHDALSDKMEVRVLSVLELIYEAE